MHGFVIYTWVQPPLLQQLIKVTFEKKCWKKPS